MTSEGVPMMYATPGTAGKISVAFAKDVTEPVNIDETRRIIEGFTRIPKTFR